MEKHDSVFELLKHRNTTDWHVYLVFLGGVLLFLTLLYVGYKWRLRSQQRRNRERGFKILERLGTEKGLSFEDEVKLAHIAETTKLKNPGLLLDSVAVFDKAVAGWMRHAMTLPWLEMEDEVAWLKKIRKQIDFRYLPENVAPTTTRELPRGGKLFAVVSFEDKLQLLVSTVLGLDDLSLYLSPFRQADQELVRLRSRHDLWCFFWSSKGGEYRFESQILKVYTIAEPLLLVAHGDHLHHDLDHSMFTCEVDIDVEITLASAGQVDVVPPDAKVFDDEAVLKTLLVHINALSSMWFRFDFVEGVGKEDLVRIQATGTELDFLSGEMGQVIRSGGRGIFCRFFNFSEEKREQLLHFLVNGISVETFQDRLRQKPR